MPDFYSINSQYDLAEIEAAVAENGGILRGFGYGFAIPSGEEVEVGGWKIMLVNRQGMGNHGQHIAVATTPETLNVQRQATLSLLRKQADEMERLAKDNPEAEGAWEFLNRGNFAVQVVPLTFSPLFQDRRGDFLGKDDKWAYFGRCNANFQRVGDGRDRLWVRPVHARS